MTICTLLRKINEYYREESQSFRWAVYKRIDTKGELTYYMNYRDEFGKNKWSMIGKESDGISVPYCKQKRSKLEYPPI
jgi:hypothetical protein